MKVFGDDGKFDLQGFYKDFPYSFFSLKRKNKEKVTPCKFSTN